MNIKQVIFDADGVLLDSYQQAMEVGYSIAALFDKKHVVPTRADYKQRFGRKAQNALVGEAYSETLREMHRLVMRHRATEIQVFENVLHVAHKITLPCSVVTSAYAEGIQHALRNYATSFKQILGRETGRKVDLLQILLCEGEAVYITDTVHDIVICHSLELPIIGVTWGYDREQELVDANPQFIARTVEELETTLEYLSVL